MTSGIHRAQGDPPSTDAVRVGTLSLLVHPGRIEFRTTPCLNLASRARYATMETIGLLDFKRITPPDVVDAHIWARNVPVDNSVSCIPLQIRSHFLLPDFSLHLPFSLILKVEVTGVELVYSDVPVFRS